MNVGNTRAELVQSIVSYRANNELPPIDHLDAVLENFLCGCEENAGECEVMELRRGFLAYIKGGISLLKFYFFPEESRADQQTADARAAKCVRCKHNTFPADLDRFVKWSDDIWAAAVSPAKSAYHDQLGHCAVCSCILKASVFYNGYHGLNKKQMSQAKEVNCWKVAK